MKNNQLRIIGGKHRGRKISFADALALRPTPDRVRETLFNWLAPMIQNANCLDLFAGSGALSFEALSRGAKSCCSIDSSTNVIAHLKQEADKLDLENIQIIKAKMPNYLQLNASPFDIVFLDAPFNKNLIAPVTILLEQNGWLSANALIYIEAEKELTPLPVPDNWQVLRNKKAGAVAYYLLARK